MSVIEQQNEVMISLLGRMLHKNEDIKRIISRGKQHPKKYIEGYNACDGKKGIVQISKIIGVSHSTLIPILKKWEDDGIVYSIVNDNGKKIYNRIFLVR
jgi:hypothetical protein